MCRGTRVRKIRQWKRYEKGYHFDFVLHIANLKSRPFCMNLSAEVYSSRNEILSGYKKIKSITHIHRAKQNTGRSIIRPTLTKLIDVVVPSMSNKRILHFLTISPISLFSFAISTRLYYLFKEYFWGFLILLD